MHDESNPNVFSIWNSTLIIPKNEFNAFLRAVKLDLSQHPVIKHFLYASHQNTWNYQRKHVSFSEGWDYLVLPLVGLLSPVFCRVQWKLWVLWASAFSEHSQHLTNLYRPVKGKCRLPIWIAVDRTLDEMTAQPHEKQMLRGEFPKVLLIVSIEIWELFRFLFLQEKKPQNHIYFCITLREYSNFSLLEF